MGEDVCYQPPVGYVDEPYMYVYDAFQAGLTDGGTYLNQTVQITGDYDFVLRRIVGLDSVIAPTGQFRWRGPNGENTSNAPVTVGTAQRDQLVLPEVVFPRTSQIAFDLYNTQRRYANGNNALVPVYQSQIGFAGVRRRQHGVMPTAGNFRRIPYQTLLTLQAYGQPAVIAAGAGGFGPQSVGNALTASLTIDNYDLEVCMLQFVDTNSLQTGAGVIPNGLNYFAVTLYNSALSALTSGYVLSQFVSDGVPFGPVSLGTPGQVQSNTVVSPTLYSIGALVPPLVYPKETQFRVSAVSLMGNASVPYLWSPTTASLNILLTGFQRIPC